LVVFIIILKDYSFKSILSERKIYYLCNVNDLSMFVVSVDVADRSDKWQRRRHWHWVLTVASRLAHFLFNLSLNIGRQNDSVPREARAKFSVPPRSLFKSFVQYTTPLLKYLNSNVLLHFTPNSSTFSACITIISSYNYHIKHNQLLLHYAQPQRHQKILFSNIWTLAKCHHVLF